MRDPTGQRPLGSEELSLTRPGFSEQALVRTVALCFLHVPQGAWGREGGRKERGSPSNGKRAALGPPRPGLADAAGPTGCSPEPELPSR